MTLPITLMIQGTTSDAGKTTLVVGLCRLLHRMGQSVAPFKPQNMALNSAVTADGGEIGRAQALQAIACGLSPHVDMNPVLLKPNSDIGSQVIVQGRVVKNMDAKSYHAFKPIALEAVMQSFQRLTSAYDVVFVEGAGSPAEINLRQGDIANMGFAEAADCPVVIVADIDKGGVFAHLVGTLELLSPSEQRRVIGFVINRFRGDIALLQPGLDWLEQRTGKPVLGVLPYLQHFYLDAEDAIDNKQEVGVGGEKLRVVIPVLPRMSNHTDFDPLRMHANVDLMFIGLQKEIPPCDLLILPGSKSVQQDLERLQDNGWLQYIEKHLRYGGKLLGICGGYQMLGQWIDDPLEIESSKGKTPGLGYLPLSTIMRPKKELINVAGTLSLPGGTAQFSGFEIHNGETTILQATANQPVTIKGESSGCLSQDQQVLGLYVHGLLDNADACNLVLEWAGLTGADSVDINVERERQIDRLADMIEQNIDVTKLLNTLSTFCDKA